MRRSLLPVIGLALGLAVAGCGGDDKPAASATSGTPKAAGSGGVAPQSPEAEPAPKGAPALQGLAKKISQAGLGCTAPRAGQVAGGTKVSCTVKGEQTNIELYSSAAGYEAARTMIKGTGAKVCSVTDDMTWLVTPESKEVATAIQGAVGGKVVCT
ncbi:hypothetical protein [Actinomadura rudentiformis]|uniref:DUF4333 domain-containing protein n=1 Tax=Actinomadura rudentiformis TaxID=359158 RepID=A0A6H9YV28_9ACTN|nr:hypothetical protein [Actinomadura rudentiformis]KAB2349616.1 hypothetical protein F8566_12705 [Actinomadura rudentiformis]